MSYHVGICEVPYDEWVRCVFILFSQVLTHKFYNYSSMSHGQVSSLRGAFSWKGAFVGFFPSFGSTPSTPSSTAILPPQVSSHSAQTFAEGLSPTGSLMSFPHGRIPHHTTDLSQATLLPPCTSSQHEYVVSSPLWISTMKLVKRSLLACFTKILLDSHEPAFPSYLHGTVNAELRDFQQRKQGCCISFAMFCLFVCFLLCLFKTSGY